MEGVRELKNWTWDAKFRLYTRDFSGLGSGCVSLNMGPVKGWTAAYNGEVLAYYGVEKCVFDSPEEAAPAVEALAKSRGWGGD